MVLAAVLLGIQLDRFLPATISWWMFGASALLLAVWILIYTKRQRVVFYLSFVTTVFLLASLHHMQWRLYSETEISRFIPREQDESIPVHIEVVASESPMVILDTAANPMSTLPSCDRTTVRVRAIRIYVGGIWRDASGNIEMFVDGHLTDVTAGSRMRVLGSLRRLPSPLNVGERDRRNHFRAERVLCHLHVGFPDCVTVVSSARRPWFNVIESSRDHCHDALDRRLSTNNVELGKALLLGARDGVPRETINAFFLTGTMHLLAISGLHLGILAFAFLAVAQRGLLPRRIVLVSLMIFIAGYAILTGARPPVVRALILIHIVCMSWLLNRHPNAMNSLAVAAIIVLLFNPTELFRVGAQLSFIAVASLSWFATRFATQNAEDPLERLIWRTRSRKKQLTDWIRRTLAKMTLASAIVWIMCLPLVSYAFHLVSPMAVALNVVMAIPVTFTLFSGVVTLCFHWLCPPIAHVASGICDHSLAVIHRIVEVAQPIPGSHFWTPGYGLAWTIVFYVVVIAVACRFVKFSRRWGIAAWVAWFVIPIATTAARNAVFPKPFAATFIAVGHGTSVLLELPNGKNMLYDCGHMGRPESCVNIISGVLWSRGIHCIDTVVVSHADADHYNALPGLLDRFAVGSVMVSHGMFAGDSDSVRFLHETILDLGVTVQTVDHRSAIMVDDSVSMRVLHPPTGVSFASDNATSVTLLIRRGGTTILLPGDIEEDGLERLLLQRPVDCDLIMAPHHGSQRSRPEEFGNWSRPEFVVISSGRRPDAASVVETFEQFGKVYCTDSDGAITATVTNRGMLLRTFIEPLDKLVPN